MSPRKRLAWLLTKPYYRRPLVADTPLNRSFWFLCYGSWRKLRNYQKLRQAYRRQQVVVDGYPAQLRVDPTSSCNLHCPLCPTGTGEVDRGRGQMSLETFADILSRFGDCAFCVNLWVWGEPLLNKNLGRMVAMAEERRVGTEVSTNLSVPLSDSTIDHLIQKGLTWLIVSLDAATAATYRRYRIGGDFELVVSNLRRIVGRKKQLGSVTPFVEWQFVPFRHNEHEMDAAWRLARRIGVDGMRFKPARIDKPRALTFDGNVPADLLAWAPRRPELRHVLQRATDSYHPHHCAFLWRSITIHPTGAIAPCCETYKVEHDFGHLKDDFATIWNGPIYTEARRVALGIDRTPADARYPCYGCKVFKKPQRDPHNVPVR